MYLCAVYKYILLISQKRGECVGRMEDPDIGFKLDKKYVPTPEAIFFHLF